MTGRLLRPAVCLRIRGKPPIGLLASLAALLICGQAAAGEVSVTDGDGLRIGEERIRVWGIDAPELGQRCIRDRTVNPCGGEARDALERLLKGGTPSCERLYRDPMAGPSPAAR